MLVQQLVAVRKHAGMIVPAPVQAVLAASLSEDAHVAEQKARYRARRDVLLAGVEAAGLVVDSPRPASTCGSPTRRPATRRGPAGTAGRPWAGSRTSACSWPPAASTARVALGHVRLALTASDERVRAAADRLGSAGPGTTR